MAHDYYLSAEALSSRALIRAALLDGNVSNPVDTFNPLNHFIDRVPQHIRQCDRFVPDGVLPCFAIEMPLTVDINIEFELDIAIPTRKNHAVRYCSSPYLNTFDYLESFEHFDEYVHRYAFRWR